MKRVLSPKIPKPGQDVELPESEAHHLTLVLRLSDGDEVEVLDGKGHAGLARLRVRGRTVTLVHSGESSLAQGGSHGDILALDLEVAVLKGEAMEWVVEKCVELGVRSVTPLITAHTVVQIDRKGPEAFRERWQRIADQALKQCGRLAALEVGIPVALEKHLAATAARPRLFADERQAGTAPPLLDLLVADRRWHTGLRVLVGPEGGWSEKERALISASSTGAVSLGPLVLRAETACVALVSTGAAFLRSRLLDSWASTKRG